MQSPEGIAGIVRLLASVAGQRAADLDELVVSSVIPCCVSRDVERAREVAAEVVLDYVLHPSASSIFGAATEPGLIDAIQTQMQAGERARAAALVSDDLAERFVVFGTPAECAEKIHVYRRAGVQRPILFPRPVTDDWTGAIWEMAEAYTSLGQISTDASRPINNRNWSNEHD
jgi:alkanesulfonate monooxygenase SsuD/methylene tetrahydromethanopterin reductase-like flavin-dependent oxidoreductase (luciferase family)